MEKRKLFYLIILLLSTVYASLLIFYQKQNLVHAIRNPEKTIWKKNFKQIFLSSITHSAAVCSDSELTGSVEINYERLRENYFVLSNFTQTTKFSKSFFEPEDCTPNFTVAIIIPYRDRLQHLQYLLGHLHPILRRQRLRYQIFVAEQAGNNTFNKGRIMNAAFLFIEKSAYDKPFDCFIFHDVDMLPENDRNIYRCQVGTKMVLHLPGSIDKFRYKPQPCCGVTVGGVVSFTGDQFKQVNGYPNNYWGWGGEDDDIFYRIESENLTVTRPDDEIGRYSMIKHKRDKTNRSNATRVNGRLAYEQEHKLYHTNGLTTLDVKIVEVKRFPLFVKVLIDVGTQSEEDKKLFQSQINMYPEVIQKMKDREEKHRKKLEAMNEKEKLIGNLR